jgi:hypothetical protein
MLKWFANRSVSWLAVTALMLAGGMVALAPSSFAAEKLRVGKAVPEAF